MELRISGEKIARKKVKLQSKKKKKNSKHGTGKISLKQSVFFIFVNVFFSQILNAQLFSLTSASLSLGSSDRLPHLLIVVNSITIPGVDNPSLIIKKNGEIGTQGYFLFRNKAILIRTWNFFLDMYTLHRIIILRQYSSNFKISPAARRFTAGSEANFFYNFFFSLVLKNYFF